MKNKSYYFIVPITFSESDGTPFVDVSVVESMTPYVSDDKIAAKNIAKTYEKHFNQPFGIVELKSIVGEEIPNELKPCPFCGEKATLQRYFDTDEEIAFYVTCSGEFCEVSPTTNDFKTEQEAREAWNRRAEEE